MDEEIEEMIIEKKYYMRKEMRVMQNTGIGKDKIRER